MKILVLTAMELEQSLALNSLHRLRKATRNHHYNVQLMGVGKVNAAATTALACISSCSEQYDLVCVMGFAGASSFFKQGDIIMPNITVYGDTTAVFNVPELTDKYELQGSDDAIIVTSDNFITAVDNDRLTAQFGSKFLVDMETCAVAQVLADTEMPLLCLKVVSDVIVPQ